MKRLSWTMMIVAPLILSACGAKKVVLTDENRVLKTKTITFAPEWVKDKGKKWDVMVDITNDTKNTVIILLKDMGCARGSVQGDLKHAFFGAGERTIDFRTGQSKKFHLVCDTKGEAKGDLSITIFHVFDNPSGDHKTVGKALEENIVWKLPTKG